MTESHTADAAPPTPTGDADARAAASATRQPLLDIRGLSIAYRSAAGDTRAVRGVDLALHPGSIVGLAGESGCGKSTLAYGSVRLLRPPAVITGGSVTYHGRRIPGGGFDVLGATAPQLRALRWREIAIVFQSAMNALNPVLRIGEQLLDALRAHTPAPEEQLRARAIEMLDLVGIPRRAHAQLPARALRRHAPAGDDRDGPVRRARGRDHGRAHHGAGRRRPARDPAPGLRAQGAAGLLGPVHHPRPVAAARGRRPGDDHVRRAGRRVRADRRVAQRPRPSLHPRAARLVPQPARPASRALGDPRLAAGPARRTGRLPVRAPLRLLDRRVRPGRHAPAPDRR